MWLMHSDLFIYCLFVCPPYLLCSLISVTGKVWISLPVVIFVTLNRMYLFIFGFLKHRLMQPRLALSSLCSWGWPWTHEPSASVSPVLGLQAYNTIPILFFSFLFSKHVFIDISNFLVAVNSPMEDESNLAISFCFPLPLLLFCFWWDFHFWWVGHILFPFTY